MAVESEWDVDRRVFHDDGLPTPISVLFVPSTERQRMLPWGHLAVGYLSYALLVRLATSRTPDGAPVLLLAVGSQFPDLVDKPLADVLNLLPSGRSLGHSLLFAAVLFFAVFLLARRYDRRPDGAALCFGHLSHVVVDALPAAVAGEWETLSFLGWPLVPAYRYAADVEGRVITEFLLIQLTTAPHHELVLLVFAIALWMYDDFPGLHELLRWGERTGEEYTGRQND